MSRTVRWVGVGLLFSLGLGVDGMQAQQPVAAEPQAPSRTVQTPPELVPTLPVPRLVKFAGVFKEEQGKARTGVVGVTLAIYKDQEGGAALWVETQNVELDEQGRYTVLLGSTKSEGLPLELFTTGEPRWLGVQVNLPKEMEQSRVLLVSVPYALKAADAESLGGKPASSYALAPTGIATGTDNGGTGGTNTSTGAQAGTGKKSTKAGATPAVVTANFIPMFTDNAGTLGNSLLVQSGNSIGLGQGAGANATVQFDVNGGIRGTGLATAGRSVAPDAINTNALFLNGSNAMGVIGSSNVAFAPGALFTKTSFYSGGVERMTVDGTTGNVGIGTPTPTQKLEVTANSTSTGTEAVRGQVVAQNSGSFSTVGVHGITDSGGGRGVVGEATSGTTTAIGVQGLSSSDAGIGVSGIASAGGSTVGVQGEATAGPVSGNTIGVRGVSASNFGTGVQGEANSSSGFGVGVHGLLFGTSGAAGMFSAGPGATLILGQSSGINVFSVNSAGSVTASSFSGSFTGSGAGLTSLNAGALSGGTVPSAALSGTYSNTLTFSNASNSFTGGGAGLTNVNAALLNGLASTAFATLGANSFAGNQSVMGNVGLTGTLSLPSTTAGGAAGVITLGGFRFVHNFGSNNTFLGANAGNFTMTGTSNTGLGAGALQANTSASNNTAVGLLALQANTASGNTAVGSAALFSNTTGAGTAMGFNALTSNTTGAGNTAVGSVALTSNSTGNNNTALGNAALQLNTTSDSNTAVGASALQFNTFGGNTAVGAFALKANTTGFSNVAVGLNALSSNTLGGNNTGVGFGALQANTGLVGGNTAVGSVALQSNTTAVSNTAIGASALQSNTTGGGNTAVGDNSLLNNTVASGNTAVGAGALAANTTGAANIAIGASAAVNVTTGNNNIHIGNLAIAGDSGVIRIGIQGTQTGGTFIAGISGATSASGVAVFVNSSGQLGTTTSSRRFKDDIADLGGESDLLMKLRPVAFYYKRELDETRTRQYGLVAEEVAQVAPQLVVFDKDGAPQTVRYHFVNAMLLNEVQKQRTIIVSQESKIRDLEARLARLEAAVARR